MFAHISQLRRTGSLKASSSKRNEPTEHQLIFSSISISTNLPTIPLSKPEQQAVEATYERIKRQFNLFPVSQLSRLFSECGLGTQQWISVAASVIQSETGWTSIINDIAGKMAEALDKIAQIRDDQQTTDKQITAVLENASSFGVPVLRHVQALLHSPEIDEDQPDDERPLPLDSELIQQALLLLVCESFGSSFVATAELMNEQQAEIRAKQQAALKAEREKQRLLLLQKAAHAVGSSVKNNNKNKDTTTNGVPSSSFQNGKESLALNNNNNNNNKNSTQMTTMRKAGRHSIVGSNVLLNTSNTIINENAMEIKKVSPEKEEANKNDDNSSNENSSANVISTTTTNNNRTRDESDQITAAVLVSNPNTLVPLEDIMLAISRLKHVATACECIISTIPVILLDQIQKLARNPDAVPPKKFQCTTLITNQVANIYARALFYFEHSIKEDPSGENPNSASYIEFSEQVGLLNAIVDMGTDPRGLPMIPVSFLGDPSGSYDGDDAALVQETSLSPLAMMAPGNFQRSNSMSTGLEPGSPVGLFRVGSAIINPVKNFHESAFFGGSGLQRLQLEQHLRRDESFQKKQQNYFEAMMNASSNGNNNNNLFSASSSFNNFNNTMMMQQQQSNQNDLSAFGAMSHLHHHHTPVPRQTFESPLRKQTISSIAQNFGLSSSGENNSTNNIQQESNNTAPATTSSSTKPNPNDIITLESIAKEFFSTTGGGIQNSSGGMSSKVNSFTTAKDITQGLSALMASIVIQQQQQHQNNSNSNSTSGALPLSQQQQQAPSSDPTNNNNSNSPSTSGLGAHHNHMMRRTSQSVVTMLKVTKQLEGVAAEGAARRKSLAGGGGATSPYTSHQQSTNNNANNMLLHSDDDENDHDQNFDYDAEAAEEERNRLRASELLERANLVCSPVMFHPGKLRVARRRGGSNNNQNLSSSNFNSLPRQDSMNSSTATSSTAGGKTSNTRRRTNTTTTTMRGHSHFLPSTANGDHEGDEFDQTAYYNRKRRSSIGMGSPPEWHPSKSSSSSILGQHHNNNNSASAKGSSGVGGNSIVKQISEAPNLSSGAKLYYLRQRLATLQQESENIGKGGDNVDMKAGKKKKGNSTMKRSTTLYS